MKDKIKSYIHQHLDELIQIRRYIHANPELSFEEHNTMEYITRQLTNHQIDHKSGIAKTGIVGVVGQGPRCVALRADIDALPMYEKTGASYASKNDGVMHACGHDVHTTCLIGAAMALHHLGQALPGQVKLLFQPAEEKLPGGAKDMIEAGVLHDEPVPEAIFGLHVHPPLQSGTLGFKSGMFMASADQIFVTFKGKGGHAAVPMEFVDPVFAAATFITQVQHIVSRKADPGTPTVISFGHIDTKGGAYNIIPEQVVIQGTLRTMDEAWRREALNHIEQLATSVASGLQCQVEVEIIHGYPFLKNDESLTDRLISYAGELIGDEHVHQLPFRMAAEDFARYTHHIPGVFFRLGVRNDEKGITAPVHSPYFDVDEAAIYYGAAALAWFAYSYLKDTPR